MRQAFLIALSLAALSIPTAGHLATASPGGTEVLDQARTSLAKHEPAKALIILEEALSTTAVRDRGPIIELLRQTYQALIRDAEAAGNSRQAAEYRDNLSILEPQPAQARAADQPAAARSSVSPALAEAPLSSPEPPPSPLPSAVAAERAGPKKMDPRVSLASASSPSLSRSAGGRLPRAAVAEDPANLVEPRPLPEPAPLPALEGAPGAAKPTAPAASTPGTRGKGVADIAGNPAPAGTGLESRPARANAPQPATAGDELGQADRFFSDKHYDEAGRIYSGLAAQNRLPAQRKQVWAYCRWVAIVARINAHPRSETEWDAIEQEIRSVQRLVPGNWYGEYLQNRVLEARQGGKPAARQGGIVVRGSAPEEAKARPQSRLFSQANTPVPSNPSAGPRPAKPDEQALGLPSDPGRDDPTAPRPLANASALAAPADQSEAPEPAPSSPRTDPKAAPALPSSPPSWQVHDSANFRIFHTDPALAEQVVRVAESVRSQQSRRWGSAAKASWTPRCDIYLYPTPGDFTRMTGQPETSPGFSTMGMNASRITGRRINLRVDHPQLLTAILPHEVTHVVVADLFTQQQIPRWADEGIAVLSEPASEQNSRAADLTVPLRDGRVFKLSELMAIDYPNADAWNLYYAQCVSLTQFLVGLGTPERFVAFVRDAQRQGVEGSLQANYGIQGFAELENRWQDFARRQVQEIASAREELAADASPTRGQ